MRFKLRWIYSRTEMRLRGRLSQIRAARRPRDPDWEFRLVVGPDYGGAFPLWIEGGEGDPDLPISDTLRRALEVWGEEWESSPWSDYRNPRDPSPSDAWYQRYRDWLGRGEVLTAQVQAELGDAYTVRYGLAGATHGEVEGAG